jgi:hypothetical protein
MWLVRVAPPFSYNGSPRYPSILAMPNHSSSISLMFNTGFLRRSIPRIKVQTSRTPAVLVDEDDAGLLSHEGALSLPISNVYVTYWV